MTRNVLLGVLGLLVLGFAFFGYYGDSDHVSDDFVFDDVLSESEIEALGFAINDEYKAHATYLKVISKFGDVRPFTNILKSEEGHIALLEALYDKYGLEVPIDDWYDKVPAFDSLGDACAAGVLAEIENAALYDELFSMVDHQDIIDVFTVLRDASRDNHLPAFERCE